MDNTKYWKARYYSFLLCSTANIRDESVDLVHDAYVDWYRLKGKDLFKEDIRLIVGKIKYTWLARLRKDKYMYKGVIYPRIMSQILHDVDPEVRSCYVPATRITPEDEAHNAILLGRLSTTLSTEESNILVQLMLGYNSAEIAKNANTYRQLIDHRINKIKTKVLSEL